jgi:DNA segregation ATPase FtsK/SpoIIIE-like protein
LIQNKRSLRRITFKVASKIDRGTILVEQGSEQLLGMGAMLYIENSSKIMSR